MPNVKSKESFFRALKSLEIFIFILLLILVWLKDQDPHGYKAKDEFVGVLWISIHPSFKKSTREYNLAILGLTFPLQFHAHMYQICLPSQVYSDSNAGP